jgi:hypothetical protein
VSRDRSSIGHELLLRDIYAGNGAAGVKNLRIGGVHARHPISARVDTGGSRP